MEKSIEMGNDNINFIKDFINELMNYISVKVANFPGLESHIYIDFRSTFLFELRDFSLDGLCRGILSVQCSVLLYATPAKRRCM